MRSRSRCTGSAIPALVGSYEKENLARNRDAAEQPFGHIVIDRQAAVIGLAGQPLPAAEGVSQSFAERGLAG